MQPNDVSVTVILPSAPTAPAAAGAAGAAVVRTAAARTPNIKVREAVMTDIRWRMVIPIEVIPLDLWLIRTELNRTSPTPHRRIVIDSYESATVQRDGLDEDAISHLRIVTRALVAHESMLAG